MKTPERMQREYFTAIDTALAATKCMEQPHKGKEYLRLMKPAENRWNHDIRQYHQEQDAFKTCEVKLANIAIRIVTERG